MGHNKKESHPESHFRIPSTPASVDDIVSVHARAYVSGLEKAINQASQLGIIHIEGSGLTYATPTTFQESLVAAGAGIALVDSVVMSQPRTLQHQRAA
ncbi:hypothetical protein QYF36_008870 [Acer negundo]|nr:hypothetical protein QYF36_008870 [Acer negundo]